MDLEEKLRILSDSAKYDVSCSSSGSERENTTGGIGTTNKSGICHSCFTVLKNLNYEGQSVSQKLKPDDRRTHIIEIIEGNSQVTALDLSKVFYVSERTIERDLKKLTDERIIEYTGSAKDGYWIVKK